MFRPGWAPAVFSLGLSEISPLSESPPCISHCKTWPLVQPTRALWATQLECVSDTCPEWNRTGLIQFPCYSFPEEYIFARARNHRTRFGPWVRKVRICNPPNTLCSEILYTHFIFAEATRNVISSLIHPLFWSRELIKYKVTLSNKGKESSRHWRRASDRHREAPLEVCSHSSGERLVVSSSTLDFWPHPPVSDSGLYSWFI